MTKKLGRNDCAHSSKIIKKLTKLASEDKDESSESDESVIGQDSHDNDHDHDLLEGRFNIKDKYTIRRDNNYYKSW